MKVLIKLFKTSLYFSLVGLISALFVIYWFIPKMIVQVETPLFGTSPEQTDKLFLKKTPGEYFSWQSEDNLKLQGFISERPDSCMGTVILLHGIRSYKESFIHLGEWFFNNHYQFVAIDHRGHGMSEGEYCSFGYHEKQDIKLLIDELEKKGCSNIGVFGQSLGGAIGIQSMAFDNRLKFGIIESTFHNFKEVSTHYFCRITGVSPKSPIALNIFPYCIDRAGDIAEFPVDRCNPSENASKINSPILLVHGDSDKRIPIYHARQNLKQLKNVTFLQIPNAGHLDVHMHGGKEYFNKVLGFLEDIN